MGRTNAVRPICNVINCNKENIITVIDFGKSIVMNVLN